MSVNAIAGRITVEKDPGHLVAGLQVLVLSKMKDGQTAELGRAFTNSEGEFLIAATDIPEPPGETFVISVRDIRHTEIKAVFLKVGQEGMLLEISIPAKAAEEHARHVTLPASPDTPFLPLPHMLDTITRAVDLIASPGTPLHDRFLEAARCPFPSDQLGSEIYREALGVLRGNPFAARHFVELVELVSTDAGDWDTSSPTEKDAKAEHVHRRWVPDDAPSLPPAKTIPIFAAVALIGRSGLHPLGRLGSGVRALISDFEDFGYIHRLAVDATGSKEALARFAAVLDWRIPECGPMPKPREPGLPLPTKPKFPWFDNWHLDCFDAVIGGSPTVAYSIASVTPAVACPGDEISIVGTNFGSSGKVVFRRLGGGELEVTARTWTNTLITVEVPATAANGLWLKIPAGTQVMCGVVIEVSLTGQVFQGFDGSAPYIEALHLGGSSMPPFVVRPGAPISLHWRVYGARDINVDVFDEAGAQVASLVNPPALGHLATLTAPLVNGRWRARVLAWGPCAPGVAERWIDIWITEDPRLYIEGIEVTQAIQYYKSSQHLTDTADQQPDNSVTLVQKKAAWVRVYLSSNSSSGFNWADIQGTLRLERIENGQVTQTATLFSQNAMVNVVAGAAYTDVRRNIDRTLNFVILAVHAHGRIRLTAECTLTSVPFGTPIAPRSVTVDFALEQQLRLAGIMVAYDGPPTPNPPPGTPNLVLNAPTFPGDLVNTLAFTLATYPIGAAFQMRNAGTVTLTVPLSDPPSCAGCCTPNWGTLLIQLAAASTADGNQAGWAYYGLLPTGVPMGPVVGCDGGVAAGGFGDEITLAHEIGHFLGRPHAPCGNVGTADPAYPAYEPYDPTMNPQAVIGEYGLDIRDGTIHPPREHDFMSYCRPQWVSLHNYAALTNAANLNPMTLPVGAASAMLASADDTRPAQRFDMINVVGRVDEDGRYHVDSVARAPVQLGSPGATQTKVQLELLDADGRKLAYGWILAYVPQAHGGGPCGCGQGVPGEPPSPPYLFEARVPFRDDGVILRIREGDTALWERRAFDVRPVLEIELCRITEQRELQLRWSAKVDDKATPDVWVQWAPGGTEDWRCLTVGLHGNEATLSATALPPRKNQIRVSLHDGFTTVFATRDVSVPQYGPAISILHPSEGAVVDRSQGLLLWGRAVDSDGELVPDERLAWRLNKREVGSGAELRFSSNDLDDGEMEAELLATGASGRTIRGVRFRVIGTKGNVTDK